MTKAEAITEVDCLRKLISEECEWNFGRMTEKAHEYLERVWKLEEEFDLPDSSQLYNPL
jgi:hypothetical protein